VVHRGGGGKDVVEKGGVKKVRCCPRGKLFPNLRDFVAE